MQAIFAHTPHTVVSEVLVVATTYRPERAAFILPAMVGQPSSKTCQKLRIGLEQHMVTLARPQLEGQVLGWKIGSLDSSCSSYSYSYLFLGLSVYTAPNYSNSKSGSWKADMWVSMRSFKGDAADCMTMNVISFTTKDGKERRVVVQKDKTFEEVEELLKAGRTEGLEGAT